MTIQSQLGAIVTPPLAEANGASVFHVDWRGLLDCVKMVDLLLTDTPYSAKTHEGHDADAVNAGTDGTRRGITYPPSTAGDVWEFVDAWHPRTRGWFVSITDDTLAPVWSAALREVGRYVFAWLPYVVPGLTVRRNGDGPASWTCWIVVARRRSKKAAAWRSLPGGYVVPTGLGARPPIVGGKSEYIMHELVKDYSNPGQLVGDPCCGAGTSLVASVREGRRAVGGDVTREHAEIAAQWIRNPSLPAPGLPSAVASRQVELFT